MISYVWNWRRKTTQTACFVAAVGLVLAALQLSALGLPGGGVAPSPAPWQVAAKLSHGELPSASCPTSTACWSVAGGELLSSDDGGATWTTRTTLLPASVDLLDAIDCPTTQECYLTVRLEDLSSAVVVVGPDGVSMTPVPGVGGLFAISCPYKKRCMTTDGTAAVITSDGGATWAKQDRPFPVGVEGLSCAAATSTCWAVGSAGGQARIAKTVNFGWGWTTQTAPNATTAFFGVDCPSTTVCYAVGYYATGTVVAATTDGGTTWIRQSASATGRLGSVSCPTTTACWAFGSDYSFPLVFATGDGGSTWQSQSLPSGTGGSPAVSCPSPTTCAAVSRGGVAFSTTNAGQGWQPVTIPTSLISVSELECPSKATCVGMTNDSYGRHLALTSPDGGVTWARHSLPAGAGFVSALDCVSKYVCAAWAYTLVPNTTHFVGQSLRTTNGGATWSVHQGPDVAGLSTADLSCSDSLTCLAVGVATNGGPAVRSTSDGGQTWQTPPVPSDASNVNAVACTSGAGVCVVVGSTGPATSPTNLAWTTHDLGATYQAAGLPAATSGYHGLDCVGQTCISVGNDASWQGRIAASYDGGQTWAATPMPATASYLMDVSCGSATVCAVTGNDGSGHDGGGLLLGTSNRGNTWSVIHLPPTGSSRPLAVSCTGNRLGCLTTDVGQFGYPRILAGDA